MASLIWKYFSPLNGDTVTALARSVKIWPTSALLKNSFVELRSVSFSSASTWLGNVPAFSNALICVSGEVSQSARACASLTCAPLAGTVRYEPPQLPPPFGKTLATFQVVTSCALPEMTPSIQPGQSIVAKAPFDRPANQSSDHWPRCADCVGLAAVTWS